MREELRDGAFSTSDDDVKLPKCPFCSGYEKHSWSIKAVGEKYMITCKCGLMSKMFDNEEELLFWWRTRAGKKPPKSYIVLKYGSRVDAPKAEPKAFVPRTGVPF